MSIKKNIIVILTISFILSVFVIPASAETTIKLNWKTATIGLGEEYQFKATTNSIKTVSWKSSDKSIVTVDKTGLVKGVQTGKATVTATVNGVSKSVNVTVKKAPNKISASDIIVTEGSSAQINAKTPAGTASKSLTYKSSDSKIAEVTSKGVVTGISMGECTITVTTFNGKKAKINVTVGTYEQYLQQFGLKIVASTYEELLQHYDGRIDWNLESCVNNTSLAKYSNSLTDSIAYKLAESMAKEYALTGKGPEAPAEYKEEAVRPEYALTYYFYEPLYFTFNSANYTSFQEAADDIVPKLWKKLSKIENNSNSCFSCYLKNGMWYCIILTRAGRIE